MGRAVRRTTGLLTAAVLSGCAANYYGTADAWTHEDRVVVAAPPGARVVLDVRQGPIEVEAGAGDSIRVELGVGPARGAGGTHRRCEPEEPPRVRAETSGPDVKLSVGPDLGDACVTRWRVVAPARVSVDLRVVAGTITVTGIDGGVATRSHAGRTEVRVPGGRVDLETNSGRIVLRYEGSDFGAVAARTNVGAVDVVLHGRTFRRPRAPGPGDSALIDGEGPNTIDVRANVGDVELRLGPEETSPAPTLSRLPRPAGPLR